MRTLFETKNDAITGPYRFCAIGQNGRPKRNVRRITSMKIFKIIRKFHDAEDGAITVDWVVLTAAVVALGTMAVAGVRGGSKTATTNINNHMSSVQVTSTF
jgi:hypothetical protein